MRRWLPLLALVLMRPRASHPPPPSAPPPARAASVHTTSRSRPPLRLPASTGCPGDVIVLDGEHEPVNDATVVIEKSYLHTDAEGLATWPDRPCGDLSLSVRVDDAVYPLDPVEIRGQEDIVVILPAERTGLVLLVDPDCEPVEDVPTRPASISAIEPLGEGRWQLWAAQDPARLPVRVGHSDQVCVVPLDGELHTCTIRPVRRVWVESEADSVWCSSEPCPREGELFACDCPYVGASVRPRQGGEERPVPDLAAQVRVSAAVPTGVLVARWTGSLPCTAKIEGAYHAEYVPCGEQIRGETMDAAPLRIEIRAGDEVGARLVQMGSGEVDAGVIAPGDDAPAPGLPEPWPVVAWGEESPECQSLGSGTND